MSIYASEYFTIDKADICVDKSELARRLVVDKSFDLSAFDSITSQAFSKISAKCVYIRVPVDLCGDGVCGLGFAKVKSYDLYKNLSGCREAFVFAVTLGIDTDRYLLRLSRTSQSSHFICDGYFSAAAESVCDKAEEKIKGTLSCKPRFSPGYGDLSLGFQKDVLTALNASKLCGISLTDSLLMTPQKSITAVMGIKE